MLKSACISGVSLLPIPQMTALIANNLCKSYGEIQALQNLDLAIEPGSFFGLLGPNGAGKSTFMSIVSGFLSADSGTLSLFGKSLDPNNMDQKRMIGLAPQHIALYKEMSAEGNLALFGKLYGLRGKGLQNRINNSLELAQLTDRRKSLVKEFSGGMMRRLNIAVALLHDPKIILCDEPTVGVDPQSRNAIFDTLVELKRQGLTVIYSTHYMEEAERLCDTIAIIDHGRIHRIGDLDTLLKDLPSISTITARINALTKAQQTTFDTFGKTTKQEKNLVLEPATDFRLSRFYAWVENENLDTRTFSIGKASLENLFLQMTGKELRE